MGLDTGNCAQHLCCESTKMHNLTRGGKTFKFRAVGGQVLQSDVVGEVHFEMFNHVDSSIQTLKIEKVVLVPNAGMNLINVNTFQSSGFLCDFTSKTIRHHGEDAKVDLLFFCQQSRAKWTPCLQPAKVP